MDQDEIRSHIMRHLDFMRHLEPNGWTCWVCLASDEEDPHDWIDPCRCIGTTRWVHLPCLMRWVDEKQQGNLEQTVSCPHCNSPYVIKEPQKGLFVILLDKIDRQGHRLSHIMAGFIIVGSVYWLAVTYGAFTVLQVMGRTEGFEVLERADPLILLLALPTVPVTLILSRLITWDDSVMYFLRRCATRFPLLGRLFPLFAVEKPSYRLQFPEWEKSQQGTMQTRLVCGGLALPSIAAFVGRLLFKTHSAVQRAVFGGLTYIFIKGLINIYHKQHMYYRMCKRTVVRASGGRPVSIDASSEDSSAPDTPASI